MSQLPGLPTIESKTINRVSAMTLIIPIKQGLTAPLVLSGSPGFDPKAAPVRYADNLRTILLAIQDLAATGEPNALNQVATIHFARWVIINEGQDLLFCANFDTSLDQYLSDFMTIANRHGKGHVPWMDLLWGNCVDYPGDEVETFVAWARRWQIDTTLFFPSISDVTLRDIAWLRKFKFLFDDFDKLAQEISPALWPKELRRAYEAFKEKVNEIDVTIVI